MNLQEFRTRHPAYADTQAWPDDVLADSLHRKYYSNMDRAEFDRQIMPPAPTPAPAAEAEAPDDKPLNFFEGRIAEPRKKLSGGPESIVPDLGPKQSPLPDAPPMSSAPDALSPEEQLQKDMFGATTGELAAAAPRRVVGGILKSVNNLNVHGQFAFKTLLKKAFPGVDWDHYANLKNEDVYSQELLQDKIARIGSDLTAEIPGEEYVDPISFKGAISAGPEALGQTGAAFLGGRQLILPLMWMQTAGGKIQEIQDNDLLDKPSGWITYLKEKGYSDEATLLLGELHGGAEIVGEKTALNLLFKKWGNNWAKDLTKFVVAETGQESITEGLQALTDKWSTEPDMTWGDFKRRYQQMLVTLPVVLGGVTAGTKTAQGVHQAIKQGVTKGQRAGKILEDLIGSQTIDPQVAEDIATMVLAPQQEGQIDPTGHMQGDQVGPGAGTKHRQVPAEQVQQDREDKAKIQKALEEELAQKELRPPIPEPMEQEAFNKAVEESAAANEVEREYTGAPVTVMEDAFKRAAEKPQRQPEELKDLLDDTIDRMETVEGRTRLPQEAPKGVEMDEQGNVLLYHYSSQEGLTELDPGFHGTGLPGAESRRKGNYPKDWVDRTYWYMDSAHKKEGGLGQELYTTSIPLDTLYPLDQDPQGFMEQATTVSKYNPNQRMVNQAKAERLIKEAGYAGYWADSPQLGKAVSTFEKVPVQPGLNPQKIANRLKIKGGFTVDPRTGMDKTDGFSVGIGLESKVPGYATPEQIRDYRTKNKEALARPDHYLGGWVYEGDSYQDVSQVHTGNAAGLKAAILQGKKNNEIGIQDLSKDSDAGYIPLEPIKDVDAFVRGYNFATKTSGVVDENVITAATKNAPQELTSAVDELIEPGVKAEDTVQYELDFAEQIEASSKGSKWPMTRMGPRQTKVLNGLMNGLKALGLPNASTLSVRAYMNLGWNSLGAHRPINPKYGNHSVLAMAGLGTPGALKKGRLRASMMGSLAHEIGHSVDTGHTMKGALRYYASTRSPMFEYGTYGFEVRTGPIVDEMRRAYINKVQGMGDIFEYPMYYTTNFKAGVQLAQKMKGRAKADAMITKEIFAQLFGFYYTFGRTPTGRALMRKHMPIGLEFMENLHEILQTSETIEQRDARVREAFRTFTPGRGEGTAELRGPGTGGTEAGQTGPDAQLLPPGPGDQVRTVGSSIRSLRGPTPTETARAVKRAEAISTIPLFEGRGQIPVKGTGPYGQVVGGDVGRAMNAWVRKNSTPIKKGDYRPATIEAVAQSLYLEVGYQLERDDSAIGWYESTLERAMTTLAQIHPELKTSADAATVFNLALAVTSNGTRVVKNFELAEQAYRGWKDSGRLPEDIGIGDRTHAINAHLKAINELIEANGIGGVREFMNDVHTVRELEAKGFKRSDELKSTSVYGSNVFGPKLGNFYQSLNGNYNPVTMDRWFTRSINRIMGTMVNPKSKTGLADSPRNGSEREWMRAIMERVQGMLSSDGVEVTTADIQALLWYHEKALFDTLRGRKGTTDEQTQEDYETAAAALLEAQQRQPTGQVDREIGGPATDLLEGQADELPTPGQHIASVDLKVPGAAGKIKRWFKRNLTKEGLLNEPAFEAKINMEGLKNFYENELSQRAADMSRLIAKAYGKKLYSQVPAQSLEDVNDYLAGYDVDLPGNLAADLDGMRAYLDRMSAGMLRSLKDMMVLNYKQLSQVQRVKFDDFMAGGPEYVPPSLQKHFYLYQTISNNMGSYLTRSYQAFDDPKWKDKALSDTDLMDRAKEFIAEQQPNLTPSQVTAEVSAILESARENGNFMNMIAKGSLLGAKDVSSLRRRKNVPEVIRELLGEYKDPRVNFVRSATKMQWFIANHNFLMRMRQEGMNSWLFENPDVVGGVAFDAEVASKDSEPMNPLGGLYTSADFKQGMRDALNKFEGSDFLRTLIAMNSAVKYGKTIGSPTTQARNFISASGFTIMNGHFNWLHGGKAMRATMSDLFDTETKWRQYINHLVRIGVLHDNAYAGELRDAIKDFTESDIYTKGWKQRPRQFLNFIQKVYRFGDDFWKIIGFENEKSIQKRNGKDEFEAEKIASNRIRNGYPTYSMVPKGIKWLRRAPLIGSFVSFPYEILRTTRNQLTFMAEDVKDGNLEGVARRVIGASMAMSGAYAASIYSMYLFGITDDDDEAVKAQLPPWSRNSQLLYTGYDENGNMRYLDLSYLDPYTYDKLWLSAILNNNNETAQEKFKDAALEFLDPFIGPDIAAQALVEVVMNKKLRGGPVYNEQDPAWLLSVLNHLRKATQPGVVNNVERTTLALNDARAPSGKPYSKFDESIAWIGLRFGTLDLPTGMIYKAYQFKDDKAKATRLLSKIAGGQNRVTDEELEAAVGKMLRARGKSYKDMIKLVNGARTLGMTDQQIRASLKAARVSSADIGALLRGKTPPWSMSSRFAKSAESRAKIRARSQAEVREANIEFLRRKRVINEILHR